MEFHNRCVSGAAQQPAWNGLLLKIGGAFSIRGVEVLASAIAQPRMKFDREDLQSSLLEKAAALGFSIIMNHPFVDGDKRTDHAAMETFLVLNGMEINAFLDE